MSIKKISKEQPEVFEFNTSNLELAKKIISNYPVGKEQSAVMALLYLAQKQNHNWIPLVAMKYIGKLLPINKTIEENYDSYKLIYNKNINIVEKEKNKNSDSHSDLFSDLEDSIPNCNPQ